MLVFGVAGKRRWRDHKIFIIQQKCNNTANIFVPEYIVVGDALTMGCAAEMKIYEYCIKQGMQEYSLQSNIKLDRYDQVMIVRNQIISPQEVRIDKKS